MTEDQERQKQDEESGGEEVDEVAAAPSDGEDAEAEAMEAEQDD